MNQIKPGTAILLPIITSILINSLFLGSLLSSSNNSKKLINQYESNGTINSTLLRKEIIHLIKDNTNLVKNTQPNFGNVLPASPVCLEENNINPK